MVEPPPYFTIGSAKYASFLSRSELCFFLNEQVYSEWQQVYESSDTGFTARDFFILVKDRVSFPLDLKVFFTQALTGNGCLREYLSQFKFFSSPEYLCKRNTKTLSAYFMVSPLQRPPTYVQNYSYYICPLSLIHEAC